MSRETVEALALRLEEYAATQRGHLMVVVHGGEPLLYPDLDYFFDCLRRCVTSCALLFSIQTNGTLLDRRNLEILERHNVHLGISVDGSRESHNKLRVTQRGEGTYDTVVQGLRLAKSRAPNLMDSVLQVIDTSVPPKEMLDLLESYGVPRADLLFPDFNYDTIGGSGLLPGDIGRWLIEAFDEWTRRENTVYIRIFMTIINLLLGGRYGTEQLGRRAVGSIIIETDGSYHIYDALKTSFAGAGITGMSVADSSVDRVETLPLAQAFRDKASAAATECLQCDLFPICGGGNPIHRYKAGQGFDLPSVYCDDLKMLIGHVRGYLLESGAEIKLS